MTGNYKYIALGLLFSLLITACSKDGADGNDVSKPNEEKKEIGIKPTSSAMSQGTSRAAVITSNADLQSQDIKIYAYYNGTDTKYLDVQQLHYDSDAWKFWDGSSQLHYYWPIEGSVYDPSSANITVSSLDFVGYWPFDKPSYITTGPTYSYSAGTISFASTMPTTTIETIDYMTSTSQTDFTEFMCAYLAAQTYADQGVSGLPMTFKHPFAYVKFNLSSATTKNVTVTEITINDLKTTGSCVFNGSTSTWSSQNGNATMKLTEELHRDETEATSPFLVIPNDYGATQKTLTVKITWREWDEEHNMTFTTPLDINWAAGYSYTYSLTITKDDLKVDIEKFTEQW